MKLVRLAGLAAVSLVGALLVPAATEAHAPEQSRLTDDGAINSGKESHDHHSAQHGAPDGHLPPVNDNMSVVGNLDLFADGEQPGRIGDVSAYGNYAYLSMYYEPTCGRGGIQIVDMTDPAAPKRAGYVPSHVDTFTGEGSQVVHLTTPHFTGELLAYNNEICPGADHTGVGGITLVDVSNPHKPKKLVEGFGDFTTKGRPQPHAHQVHSAFVWQDGARAYLVMVDDEEATDVDILDITNPRKPVLISETDLTAFSAQPPGAVHGDSPFLHDMVVKNIDGRQTMLASYWDGGYVILDVSNPAQPVPLRHTDFAAADPVRAQFGHVVSPEGNAHQAEFTRDNELFIATDEDFDAYRVQARITSGPHAATEFTAVQGSDVPHIDTDTSAIGGTRFVGLACDTNIAPADATHTIAVIERGVCNFTPKIQNVQAAGYAAAIVFNRTGVDGCETLISMLAEADIPAIFVSRMDGFRILGASLDGYTCSESGAGTAAPAAPVSGSSVDVRAVFDGWGYVHLYDARTMQGIDQYFVPESQDPAYASGFGDLSVHEVATDPDTDLAYISYYAAGLRVVRYSRATGLTEVGAFIAPGGNNFWGVEVHKHPNGQKYILASDRDSGVWIFQYTGP